MNMLRCGVATAGATFESLMIAPVGGVESKDSSLSRFQAGPPVMLKLPSILAAKVGQYPTTYSYCLNSIVKLRITGDQKKETIG